MHEEENADAKSKAVRELRELVASYHCHQPDHAELTTQEKMIATYNGFTEGAPAIDGSLAWHSLFCHRATAHTPLVSATDTSPAGLAEREVHKLVGLSFDALRRFLADAQDDAAVGPFARAVTASLNGFAEA